MEIYKFLEKTYGKTLDDGTIFRDVSLMCNDGFNMSVQASSLHYCNPRVSLPSENVKNYQSVEIGKLSEKEDLLMKYIENDEDAWNESIYPFVSVEIVEEIINKHNGLNWDAINLTCELRNKQIKLQTLMNSSPVWANKESEMISLQKEIDKILSQLS